MHSRASARGWIWLVLNEVVPHEAVSAVISRPQTVKISLVDCIGNVLVCLCNDLVSARGVAVSTFGKLTTNDRHMRLMLRDLGVHPLALFCARGDAPGRVHERAGYERHHRTKQPPRKAEEQQRGDRPPPMPKERANLPGDLHHIWRRRRYRISPSQKRIRASRCGPRSKSTNPHPARRAPHPVAKRIRRQSASDESGRQEKRPDHQGMFTKARIAASTTKALKPLQMMRASIRKSPLRSQARR